MKYDPTEDPWYYKKRIDPAMVKKTIKIFVLLPLKDCPLGEPEKGHCIMCKSLESVKDDEHSVKHNLYKCLSQFMILEYITVKRGSHKVNDHHVKMYVDQKWLRLGPKIMEEFNDMGIPSYGESIPMRYR